MGLSRNGAALGAGFGGGVAAIGAIESFSGFILGSGLDTTIQEGDLIGVSAAIISPFFLPWTDVEIRFVAGFFRT